MLTPPPLYADVPARLAALEALVVAAYWRHARKPALHGPAGAHLMYWAAYYEALAALAENNPVFARTLLPGAGAGALAWPGVGLPLVPAGVLALVDKTRRNSISVTVDVAGPVTLSVLAPHATTPFAAVLTRTPTRASTTFDAPADGLYRLILSVGSTVLARVLVPVQRAEFRRFRENSRAQAHAFLGRKPRPHGAFKARLARIMAAEAAAQTGQPELFARLAASAAAVPTAPAPVALYPHG